jgi:hypothetical protein
MLKHFTPTSLATVPVFKLFSCFIIADAAGNSLAKICSEHWFLFVGTLTETYPRTDGAQAGAAGFQVPALAKLEVLLELTPKHRNLPRSIPCFHCYF